MTVDDWAGDPINFCKPVAKLPTDRVALLQAAIDGSGKFFFGSDSAPHLLSAKKGLTDGGLGAGKCAAGVFTQPNVVGFVLDAVETAVEKGVVEQNDIEERLAEFLSKFGRKFYKLPATDGQIKVVQGGVTVQDVQVDIDAKTEMEKIVVSFRSGKSTYGIEWI